MNSYKKSKNEKVDLDNIKSVFFVSRIFELIEKTKKFEIIKYNKKIQKKLNLSFKDYKEYFNYLRYDAPIEIEIIPKYRINRFFINIPSIGPDWKRIHIYFDDKKEEIFRYYFTDQDANVKKIKIIIDPELKMLDSLFSRCNTIESISFKRFSRINIVSMSHLFFQCESLKKIDFSHFKTDNVENMENMFAGCTSLKELDLSNFKTNNVENMGYMFDTCTSLEKINFSNFNTNNVNLMQRMFYCCFSLKELNLSSFNTKKVMFMHEMFFNCRSLKELNLSNFKINTNCRIDSMFHGCKSLIKLDISHFNVNFNTNQMPLIEDFFFDCSLLKELYIPNLDNYNQEIKIGRIFNGCSEELKKKIKEKFPNLFD